MITSIQNSLQMKLCRPMEMHIKNLLNKTLLQTSVFIWLLAWAEYVHLYTPPLGARAEQIICTCDKRVSSSICTEGEHIIMSCSWSESETSTSESGLLLSFASGLVWSVELLGLGLFFSELACAGATLLLWPSCSTSMSTSMPGKVVQEMEVRGCL